MKIININFQSIKNKKEELNNLIEQSDPSIIIGTEAWLNPSISSAEIFPPNYEVFRKDRNDGYGGVLLTVHRDFITDHIDPQTKSESVFTKLTIGKNQALIIDSLYRPPRSDISYMEQLCGVIENIHSNNKNAILWLGGDLNLSDQT